MLHTKSNKNDADPTGYLKTQNSSDEDSHISKTKKKDQLHLALFPYQGNIFILVYPSSPSKTWLRHLPSQKVSLTCFSVEWAVLCTLRELWTNLYQGFPCTEATCQFFFSGHWNKSSRIKAQPPRHFTT